MRIAGVLLFLVLMAVQARAEEHESAPAIAYILLTPVGQLVCMKGPGHGQTAQWITQCATVVLPWRDCVESASKITCADTEPSGDTRRRPEIGA